MRNSNIELLRIIATVMVLLLHANFGAFAPPIMKVSYALRPRNSFVLY